MSTSTPAAIPILLEIVEGTIESSRKEMELQVERTARSTVIREQHDYRAAVFDRRGRGSRPCPPPPTSSPSWRALPRTSKRETSLSGMIPTRAGHFSSARYLHHRTGPVEGRIIASSRSTDMSTMWAE